MAWKSFGLVCTLVFTTLVVGCGEAANTVITPDAGYQRTPAEEARFQQGDTIPKEEETGR
jgi:hypothetical protein